MAYSAVVSAIEGTPVGNRVTIAGATQTFAAAAVTSAVLTAAAVGMRVIGDIAGFLRFPFADPDTLEGALTPADLTTAQIKLTQGGAGGTLTLLCEEVYGI